MGSEIQLPPQGEFRKGAMQGYKRLAAALIFDGLRAYERWHDPRAMNYRRMQANELASPRGAYTAAQWALYGMKRTRPLLEWCQAHSGGRDPYIFLTTNSIWHELIDLDPARVKRLLGEDVGELRRKLVRFQRIFSGTMAEGHEK